MTDRPGEALRFKKDDLVRIVIVLILETLVLYAGVLVVAVIYTMLHRADSSGDMHQSIFKISSPIVFGLSVVLGRMLRAGSHGIDRKSVLHGSILFLLLNTVLNLPSPGEPYANSLYGIAEGTIVAVGVITSLHRARPTISP